MCVKRNVEKDAATLRDCSRARSRHASRRNFRALRFNSIAVSQHGGLRGAISELSGIAREMCVRIPRCNEGKSCTGARGGAR